MGLIECFVAFLLGLFLFSFSGPFVVLGALLLFYRRCTAGVGFNGMELMDAAIYDHKAPDCIRVVKRPRPRLKRGHCVVKVHAAGLNPVDAKGVIGDKFPESWMGWCFWVMSGFVVGFDFSGVVEEAGPKSPFKVGDEVFGLNYQLLPIGLGKFQGTLQQFALVPEHEMWKKPESLNHTEAASLPLAGLTCLQAFDQHNLQAGQELLVVGASGGVGHVATAFASRLGVNVTGICSTANVQFVKECGAVRVLDYRAEEPIMEQVSAVTAEHGKFDIVFDTVSSADSRDKAADYERRIRSRKPPVVKAAHGLNREPGVDKHNYVVFGGLSISWWRALVLRLTRKAKCAVNFFPLGFELFWIDMPHSAPQLKRMKMLCDDKGMRPKVMKTLPFTDEGCRAAFHSLNPPPGERRAVSGKVVVEIVTSETKSSKSIH